MVADESPTKKARTEGTTYYKVIDGVKYDKALLEKADEFAKDGQISYAEAKKLYVDAEDGKGITDIEKQTLEYAMKTYKFSEKANNFLTTLLKAGTFKSYYKVIGGVKYDRDLLEKAEIYGADGQISFPEAKQLIETAKDGKGITDIEKATLEYAHKNLKFTEKAKRFFEKELGIEAEKAGSYYKVVDGVKYDRELLETAERFGKDGQISYAEAKYLWEDAQDGKGVTDIEKATLEYISKTYKFSEKGSNFLKVQLESGKHTSYYKVIDGEKYDRELLEKADKLAADGQISVDDAKKLWESAKDGKGLTDIEKATLQYALKTLKFTEAASEFLTKELA